MKEYQSKEKLGQTGHKFMKSMNDILKAQGIPAFVKADIVKKGGIFKGYITVKSTSHPDAQKVVIDFVSVKAGNSSQSAEFTVGATQGDDDYVVKSVGEMIGKKIAKDIGMKYNAPWGTLLDKEDPSSHKHAHQPKSDSTTKSMDDYKAEHKKTADNWKAEHKKTVDDWGTEHQKMRDRLGEQMAGK